MSDINYMKIIESTLPAITGMGGIILGAFLSHKSSSKTTKLAHKQQLRANMIDSLMTDLYRLKDIIQIAEQSVSLGYHNKDIVDLNVFNEENIKLFNDIYSQNTKVSSYLHIHGRLFNIESYNFDIVTLSQNAIQSLAIMLQQYFKSPNDKYKASNKIDELYDDMKMKNQDAVNMILECIRKVENSYYYDIK